MFKHRHANNTPGGDSLSLKAKQNKKNKKTKKKKTKKKKQTNMQFRSNGVTFTLLRRKCISLIEVVILRARNCHQWKQ